MAGTPCKPADVQWMRATYAPRADCAECPWPNGWLIGKPAVEAKKHAATTGHYVEVITETRAFYCPPDWTPIEGTTDGRG
jgi:hypothetical protein